MGPGDIFVKRNSPIKHVPFSLDENMAPGHHKYMSKPLNNFAGYSFDKQTTCSNDKVGAIFTAGKHGGAFSGQYRVTRIEGGYTYAEPVHAVDVQNANGTWSTRYEVGHKPVRGVARPSRKR
jgi:hypothetical protein